MNLWAHFLTLTGTRTPTTGAEWYNFWSGFGSDVGEVVIIGALVQIYRRHKCQSCWRPALKFGLGRVHGTHYETCHKHTNVEHHNGLRKQHAILFSELHEHLTRERDG